MRWTPKHFVAIPVFLAALAGGAIVLDRRWDHPPSGEGSYEAAARLLNELKLLNRGGTRLPAGYHRFRCADDSWYVATGTDSHRGPDGGTFGILTSDGEIGVFFGHVCGTSPMALEFEGNTAREVIALLRRTAVVYSPDPR